ncbi:hypothetical protein [Microbacterium sp. CBA3102]|uniref:hypothetical protein n=1 Tax=Microbacterium sp. CBA3102 TaxID=2603598 RepID=UPI0018840909|nr:hypothetical protein [Microbacterium sp. CBA3102]
MTEAQIQTFFNSKVSRCLGGRDENNEPIVCLKDFRMNTVTRPADAYCSGYSGAANESAARIIYRVSQACNINPQVLIVMLQKEQGLITHVWPSAWRYRIALGQGCPDTAPCDPNYIGFFHQIYGAARQMQIYMEGKWFQWYAPGKTWNILYNPKASCGSAPVYVANKATSALYYYTPYQPNAAAMRAGYGEGDGCSAYGNRNFYNYFTDWFGSTQSNALGEGAQAISAAWAAAGGKSGSWGNRLDAPACSGSVPCGHVFEKAIAYWQPGKGVILATGSIALWVRSQGVATTGYPDSAPVSVTENGGGVAQSFTKVLVNAGPSGIFAVSGLTRTAHGELGGVRQATGWPTSAKTCSKNTDYCVQSFQKAVISEVGGHAYAVAEPTVLSKYIAEGGPKGRLGIPTSDLVSSSASGGGQEQAFVGGAIGKTSAGVFSMTGEIRVAHSRAGGVSGQLGWVTSDSICNLPKGACVQTYQKGSVVQTGATAFFVAGPVATFYQSNGGPAGALGYPVSDTIPVSANGGGVAQAFTNGLVNAGPAGAFLMTGAIRDAHGKAGGVGGPLGWPTAAQACGLPNGGCSQSFQNGTIYVVGGVARVVSKGPVATFYQSNGGPAGALGYPVSDTIPVSANGGGVAQAFTNGLVNAGPAGAFLMTGAIRDAHGKAGGVGGPLGWPTAAQACGLPNGGCSQSFQNGTIYVVGGVARVVSKGPVATFYQSNGGPAGALGYPVSDTIPVSANGGGVAQAFTNGLVNAGPAGAFLMTGAIRDAHGKAGGVGGPLGWPTAAQACGLPNGGCSQSFQNGTIYVVGGVARVVSKGPVATFYQSNGGPAGALGYPVSDTIPVSANGGGVAQAFTNGLVNAGPAGAFLMTGAIRDAHGKAGGVGGPLGWPTAAQACGLPNGGCSQSFQNGTINVDGTGKVTIAR